MELVSPSEQQLVNDAQDNTVRMKKQLGLLEGVAIILGIIFGSGMILFTLHYINTV